MQKRPHTAGVLGTIKRGIIAVLSGLSRALPAVFSLERPHRIVLCLLIGVLVGLIGVALGASLIMVLLVALTAAGLTMIIAKA